MPDSSCTDCVVEVQAVPVKPTDTNTTTSSKHDPMDVSAFTPPVPLPVPSVTIEFCNRCRWLHRATWISTELLLTFTPPTLKGVHIIPLNEDETAGRFRVWLSTEKGPVLIWDRKVEGGFPELKVLKQRIRDRIDPGKSLGHSDKHD
ncbi:uncharacterized protein FOMMEDRAFT_90589 [Fomitiporia mediterranea MF3/22]|uniref:uncharacterized protein n=1 Tax=Fomitiporia mediterranea (strain MF3/22) TaxID=694068 RepID=UPI0004409267|nr:uncharacterized protein FOMMEDRAFT_90589 [Fomitiporia mediterranea MF3/22]EJD01064.1 hypothetical protein FOMMEDRAFT_90589 [Fomitiporia mediterranea MF3/22]